MAGAGALAGSAAFMRPDMLWAQGLGEEQLRTVGLSVTVQERILNDFKAASGVGSVSGKAAIFPDTQTELLSGSDAYDCWETIGERLPAVIATKKIESIPIFKKLIQRKSFHFFLTLIEPLRVIASLLITLDPRVGGQ